MSGKGIQQPVGFGGVIAGAEKVDHIAAVAQAVGFFKHHDIPPRAAQFIGRRKSCDARAGNYRFHLPLLSTLKGYAALPLRSP